MAWKAAVCPNPTPDKGGMRGISDDELCKKLIAVLQTSFILPLPEDGWNNKRPRVMTA
jgi:hypothetical protein